jgi:hypothetical protein
MSVRKTGFAETRRSLTGSVSPLDVALSCAVADGLPVQIADPEGMRKAHGHLRFGFHYEGPV